MEWFAGPVLKCNDTEDDRAKVLDSEELMLYLHQRAQAAVNSRDDAEDHQRHVSFHILANLVKPQCTNPEPCIVAGSTVTSLHLGERAFTASKTCNTQVG